MNSFQNRVALSIESLPWKEPAEIFANSNIGKFFFFLDSASTTSGRKNSRWSYISVGEAAAVFRTSKGRTTIIENGKTVISSRENPFKLLNTFMRKFKVRGVGSSVPFCAGAAGYFSYECANYFEGVPNRAKQKIRLPELYFFVPSCIMAFDNKLKKRYLLSWRGRMREYTKNLKHKKSVTDSKQGFRFSNCRSNFNLTSFSKIVKKTKRYIAAGDIFQANLAQKWEGDFEGEAKDVYLKLRSINPSPYSCYFRFPELELISCSPELLLKRDKNLIETMPIAGTRRRGVDPKEDFKFRNELKLDEKERAEHIMLVDLERNDLGRIAKYKSVELSDKMRIEQYSHVSHIVSTIKGTLKNKTKLSDILRAVFPGGTITGCPKIRAMEIIDELEPVERGPYCGSAGWLGFDGNLELNILIRTIIVSGRKAFFYAGAGIVADSLPEREYKETKHKARALATSLGVRI